MLPDNAVVVIALDQYYHYAILQSAIHEYWAWARGSTLKGDLRYTNTTIFETFPFPLLDSGRGAIHGSQGTGRGATCGSQDSGRGGTRAAQSARRGAIHGSQGRTSAAPTDIKRKYDPRVVPDTPEAARVSRVAEKLYEKRQAACKTLNLGLTKLYNLIKGKTPLDKLSDDHRALNTELQDLHVELNNAVCACYGWPEDTWRDENEVLKRLLKLNLALTSDEGMLG